MNWKEAIAVNEEIAETLEEAAEVTRSVTERDMGLVFFGSCVGTIGGIAIGYFLSKKKMEAKYEQILEEEAEELREHYRQKLRALELRTEKATLEEVVKDEGYRSYSDVKPSTENSAPDSEQPVVEVKVENVFHTTEPETPEWDQAEEEKNRDSAHPYVIHKDEYKANEKSYDQTTFAYYADDDVLANDDDKVVDIQSQEGLVPRNFVELFGHGSGDPNVVYIRCDEVAVEIEIVRNNGNYAEVVHGFLKHSDDGGRRRRRHFDDE